MKLIAIYLLVLHANAKPQQDTILHVRTSDITYITTVRCSPHHGSQVKCSDRYGNRIVGEIHSEEDENYSSDQNSIFKSILPSKSNSNDELNEDEDSKFNTIFKPITKSIGELNEYENLKFNPNFKHITKSVYDLNEDQNPKFNPTCKPITKSIDVLKDDRNPKFNPIFKPKTTSIDDLNEDQTSQFNPIFKLITDGANELNEDHIENAKPVDIVDFNVLTNSPDNDNDNIAGDNNSEDCNNKPKTTSKDNIKNIQNLINLIENKITSANNKIPNNVSQNKRLPKEQFGTLLNLINSGEDSQKQNSQYDFRTRQNREVKKSNTKIGDRHLTQENENAQALRIFVAEPEAGAGRITVRPPH